VFNAMRSTEVFGFNSMGAARSLARGSLFHRQAGREIFITGGTGTSAGDAGLRSTLFLQSGSILRART
jgi:hypothetical protein